MKNEREWKWKDPKAILACAEALDRIRRGKLGDCFAIKAYADMLHEDFECIRLQDAIPSTFDCDILPRWAKTRKLPDKTIRDINNVLHGEILNLLWVYSYGDYEGSVTRARDFCMMLHMVACAVLVEENGHRAA